MPYNAETQNKKLYLLNSNMFTIHQQDQHVWEISAITQNHRGIYLSPSFSHGVRVSSRGSQYHALQRASLVDPESVTLALVQQLDTWPHHWKAWLAGVRRSRRDRRTWPLIGSLPKYFTWISSPGLNPKTRASWTWSRRWRQHFITRVQICVAYICHVHNIVRHNIMSDMQHNYVPC